ncbi:MAG: hypothetical protein SFW35_07020 [Chitinophagales bacterium]|nr:hypothetical protein [Chitinophagales bacterium]
MLVPIVAGVAFILLLVAVIVLRRSKKLGSKIDKPVDEGREVSTQKTNRPNY